MPYGEKKLNDLVERNFIQKSNTHQLIGPPSTKKNEDEVQHLMLVAASFEIFNFVSSLFIVKRNDSHFTKISLAVSKICPLHPQNPRNQTAHLQVETIVRGQILACDPRNRNVEKLRGKPQ